MEIPFLSGDVTDDELAAGLAALEAGRYPGWRLADRVEYEASRGVGGALALHRFIRVWLLDPDGCRKDVTLQRLHDPPLWRRVAVPGENAP